MATDRNHNMTLGNGVPKVIKLKNRQRSRLDQALQLYREILVSEAQYPESQLRQWNQKQTQFANQFGLCAIEAGEAVVGFFQYSYFNDEHIVFIRSLCIRNVPDAGEFDYNKTIKSIKDFLAHNYTSNDLLVVCEIPWVRLKDEDWHSNSNMTNHLELLGFRKLDLEYKYPAVRRSDGEGAYRADLLTWRPRIQMGLSLSAIQLILRTIFFNYYLRWDRAFLELALFEQRNDFLTKLHSAVELQVKGTNNLIRNAAGSDFETTKQKTSRPLFSRTLEKFFEPKLARLVEISILVLLLSLILQRPERFTSQVLATVLLYRTISRREQSKH
jgi:hypothetical protein